MPCLTFLRESRQVVLRVLRYVARVFEQPLSLGHCRSLFLAYLGLVYWWSSVVFSSAQSCFATSPRVCLLCSTSLPAGNQVDGLPPAPSLFIELRMMIL